MNDQADNEVFQACQWFRNGDHPDDGGGQTEGQVVRYFRDPDVPDRRVCGRCGHAMHSHGWLDNNTNNGNGQTVCPGDYVIKRFDGVYASLEREWVEAACITDDNE